MTAARRLRKLQIVPLLHIAFAAPVMAGSVQPADTEYIVVDRHSGLAIDGFDPVAYFIDAAPVVGKGAYELSFAGAVWRFRNEGNRAAFLINPEIYMPRFGGYDPLAIARGVGVAGNPRYWLISGGRLYLFYSKDSQSAFAARPAQIAAAADRQWSAIERTLAR